MCLKVVRLWIDRERNIRPYIFQLNFASSHKTSTTQAWMFANLQDYILPDTWLRTSVDLNPLNYYQEGAREGERERVCVCEREREREFNQHFLKLQSLKSVGTRTLFKIDEDHLVRACPHLRSRIKAAIEANGGSIE